MSPRLEKGCMSVILKTHADWYIVANMSLLNEIKAFFGGETKADKVDLTYYKEWSKNQAVKYMNLGSDYFDKKAKVDPKYQHRSYDVDITLQAPVIFIPEDLNNFIEKRCLVVSMGSINVSSNLLKWDSSIDYKVFTNPALLYDSYQVNLTNFSVSLTKDMAEY
jgi:hypothetical protein